MNKINSLPIISTAALMLSAAPLTLAQQGDVPPSDSGIADISQAKEINPAFTTDLYQRLRNAQGNVFFSPYSITEAMGMVYMGARGNTAAEFVKAMGFDSNQETFGRRMSLLRKQVISATNQKDAKLNIANALCVTGITPMDSYLQTVRSQFDAEVFDGGLEEINGWVNKKTEGNIEKILEELSADSACVLLNAVYFKGEWQTPFYGSMTQDAKFFVTPDKAVDVRMMSREGNYALAQNDEWVAVEMPYKSGASMVLLMPSKAEAFEAFEAKLDEDMVSKVCKQLAGAKQHISLKVPKFKIATEYDLIAPLKELAIKDAFGNQADFSAMYKDRVVKISQIKHKATLEVDELGSVASAATAVEMEFLSGARYASAQAHFNRPFIVLIRENSTNSTLFMGRILNPTANNSMN